jgi:transcriptional regulator with XRE-family HTH domain
MRHGFNRIDIVAARAEAGLSQTGLASLLGVTQATISRWEMGAQEPSPSLRQKLVTLLDEAKSKRAAELILAHSPFKMALVRRDWTVIAVSAGLAGLYGNDINKFREFSLREVATAEMEQIVRDLDARGFFSGTPGVYRLIGRGVKMDSSPCTFDVITTPVSYEGSFVMFNQINLVDEETYLKLRQTHDLVTPLK